MGTVYRKVYTQPLPSNAQIFERNGEKLAMWVDFKGKKHIDQITTGRRGQIKLLRQSPTFIAQYRDADGQVVIESTGCKDEQAARHVLAERVKRVEHIKAGIITTQQCRTADHARTTLEDHVDAYLEHLQAKTIRGKRVSAAHRTNVQRQLETLITDCKYRKLQDITRDSMEKWMNRSERDGMGARTRNSYRAAIVAFCNWAQETDRMIANPLSKLCTADEHSDRRRTRRALTEDELNRLFTAARLRPLAEYGRESVALPPEERKGHKSWHKAPLTFEQLKLSAQKARNVLENDPNLISQLQWLGRERPLIYKVLALTGMRKNELASITVGQVWLDEKQPYFDLKAKDEKSGKGTPIPIRSDLVTEIRQFMRDKLVILQNAARKSNVPVPARLHLSMPLFDMPRSMVGIFDRDLAAAGIPKRDERGRTLDIHALRHTFGTHLSRAGVAPRVAQAAMRHSSLHLTMNIYTDPTLLDVAGAINSLPKFANSESAITKTAK